MADMTWPGLRMFDNIIARIQFHKFVMLFQYPTLLLFSCRVAEVGEIWRFL